MERQAERQLTELGGVYAVASKLALQGWQSILTMPGFPGVDLIAYKSDDPGHTITIQVKAGREPSKKGWGLGNMERTGAEDPWHLNFDFKANIYVFVGLVGGKTEFYVFRKKDLYNYTQRKMREWNKKTRGAAAPKWLKGTKPQPFWVYSDEFPPSSKDKWDVLP